MDGPKFVCAELSTYCADKNIPCHYRELSTDAGYYAWHFYFKAPVEIMPLGGDVESRLMWVEIQLTTQLAEVIGALTHGLYEERRTGRSSQDGDWKWDANSQRFRSAYLGHGLHLLEGIIQTFRDDVLGLRQAPTPPPEAAPVANELPSVEQPSFPEIGGAK
jgi:hypothetical protein